MRFPWSKRETPVALQADRPAAAFELNAPAQLMQLWGIGTGDYTTPVSRAQAMSVPAVKKARDLIAGSVGGLPVRVQNERTRERLDLPPLLAQPEAHLARSVTMVKIVEDLLFNERSWLRIVEKDAKTDYPTKVRRLDHVLVRENQKVYAARDGSVQGDTLEQVPDSLLIRIESPTDGWLTAGARVIRQALLLDKLAARIAASPRPQGVFTPVEGVDPGDRDEIQEMLDDWNADRGDSTWGYVGAALKLNPLSWTAEEIQLADSRQHAVLEIARLTGLDAEDLGVSTTSRTYQNSEQRRLDRITDVLLPYIEQENVYRSANGHSAIQDRLSMDDVLPPGRVVRFGFDGFLRADSKTRYEALEIGRRVGAYDDERIAEVEDIPVARVKAPEPTPAAPTPMPAVRENADA